MNIRPSLLELSDITVRLPIDGEERLILDHVGLSVSAGEAVGLVGESGSGKSMTLRSILGLLPPGAEITGDIRMEGRALLDLGPADLRSFRATDVAMIFQDPRAHVNPVRTIGDFLTEALVINRRVKLRKARLQVGKLLGEVGIPDAERRLRQHPHELSGGMLQRVMIAAALAVEPKLILADEPTTALDVTTQEEVMAILDEQRRERDLAMIFVSHDLDLAAAICDRTAVMYAGTIAEIGVSDNLHHRTAHPYTVGLLKARPGLNDVPGGKLTVIPGRPTPAYEADTGCPFAPRCYRAEPRCVAERPALRAVGGGRSACFFAEEVLADA